MGVSIIPQTDPQADSQPDPQAAFETWRPSHVNAPPIHSDPVTAFEQWQPGRVPAGKPNAVDRFRDWRPTPAPQPAAPPAAPPGPPLDTSPQAQADVARATARPGVGTQVVQGAKDVGHLLTHPSELVEATGDALKRQAHDAVTALRPNVDPEGRPIPSVTSDLPLVGPVLEGVSSRLAPTSVAEGARAKLRTAANLAAYVAPGGAAGRIAAQAGAAALSNPDEPVRAAVGGAGLGLATHGAAKLLPRVGDVVTAAREQLADPYAVIKTQGAPGQAVAQALTAANARNALPNFAGEMADRVTKGLTDPQRDQFGKAMVAAQLDMTPNGAQHAAALRAQLPAGVTQTPWFRAALARHLQYVEPLSEQAAAAAGVDPATFRRTALGAYVKLIADNGQGQPVGSPGSPGSGPKSTQVSGSAKQATGGAQSGYLTDYKTLVTTDAMDKLRKAAVNDLWRVVAANHPEIQGKIPQGQSAVGFTNRGQIVTNPTPDPGVRVFATTPEVTQAINEFVSPRRPGPAAAVIGKAASVPTSLVISNPFVAFQHALRMAANVEKPVPAGDVVGGARRIAETAVPFGQSSGGLARAMRLDLSDPKVTATEHALARIGALRVEDPASESVLGKVPAVGAASNAATRWLFGPEGIDRKLRIVAAQDFTADRQAKGLPTSGPEYDNSLRSYVTGKLGEPTQANRGRLFHGPVAGQVAPFAGVHAANIGTDLGGVVGDYGNTPTPLQRAAQIATGPVGKAAAVAAGSALASGHSPTGSGYDLPIVKDAKGTYHYFRGSPEAARTQFGPVTQLTVRDLAQGPISKILSNTATESRDKVYELLREATNLGLGFAGPTAQAGYTLATGAEPYVPRSGGMASAEREELDRSKRLAERVSEAGRDIVTGGSLLQSANRPEQGTTTLMPLVSERPVGGEAGRTARDVTQYLRSTAVPDVRRAPDSASAERAVNQALAQIRDRGVDTTSAAYQQATASLMQAFVERKVLEENPELRQAGDRRDSLMLAPAP